MTKPFTQNEAEEIFKNYECELLEDYKNNATKVKTKCKCGSIFYISLSKLQTGQRCYKCGRKEASKKQIGDKNHKWNPNRDQVELNKKIRTLCSSLLKNTLKSTGKKKSGHTYDLLGYTKEQLLEHLQKDPLYYNWLNKFNPHDYHIDHIISIKAFTDHNIIDPKIINKLTNLRILPGPDNEIKSDVYLEEDFQLFLLENDILMEKYTINVTI